MRKTFLSLLLLFSLSAAPAPRETMVFKRPFPQTPGEVIAIINDYRAANGLYPFQINNTLMSIAQGQADYLASIVQTNDVHAGPGGTRPRDRAYAAGYGGGSQFWISEIGKYGISETPDSAVNWWKQSPDHNPTMVSDRYQEVGCGVAAGGENRYYYICDMAYVVGGTFVPSNPSGGTQPTPAPVIIPVTKATPLPDGSIIHIMRTGQTIWTLAAEYGVTEQQIYDLNPAITNPLFIPVGVEIIIAAPGSYPTVQPTRDPTATLTEEPAATKVATSAPQPTPETQPTVQPTEAEQFVQADPAKLQEAEQQNATVKLVVGMSLAGILMVIAASFFIKKPLPPEPPDNDPFAPIQ